MQANIYKSFIVKNGILFHILIDTPMPEAGGDVGAGDRAVGIAGELVEALIGGLFVQGAAGWAERTYLDIVEDLPDLIFHTLTSGIQAESERRITLAYV